MAGWSDADKDLLRTMWARGESSRDIAEALSIDVSRNAVMGMVNRLGLMGLGHPDVVRLAMMDKVGEIMDEPFSFGSPLHRESLLAFLVGTVGRDSEALSIASGVSRADCSKFLDRLPMVWPGSSKRMPSRWMGSLEGTFSFVLDMAVVAGKADDLPPRPGPAVNEDDPAEDTIAA